MMFGEDYAYAVARIRVLETGLLNQAAIEQLLACQDEQQCLQILTEKAGSGPICVFCSFLSGSFP